MPSAIARQLKNAFHEWWRERVRAAGALPTASLLLRELWGFARDSTPERRRSRYGDMDFDWQYRVNTTSGSVGWRERLLGIFLSPYMPTDPAQFQEMMAALPVDFRRFTFIDVGCGKGRALLMASEYPFRRIVGVEILPSLSQAASGNTRDYKSPTQQCSQVEVVCADARNFELPPEPLVLYLFNPLPEPALREFTARLEDSLTRFPREVWLVYCNPLLEEAVARSRAFQKISTPQHFSIFTTA